MVDKILNQSVDGITVREVLELSPYLLRELWGVKRLPALKGSIPAMTGGDPQEMEKQVRFSNQIEPIERHLYACASPTVHGRIEGKHKIKMLIDRRSEMCVMSKKLWKRLEA